MASLLVLLIFCAFTKCPLLKPIFTEDAACPTKQKNTKQNKTKRKRYPIKFLKIFLPLQKIPPFRSRVGNFIFKVHTSIFLGQHAHSGILFFYKTIDCIWINSVILKSNVKKSSRALGRELDEVGEKKNWCSSFKYVKKFQLTFYIIQIVCKMSSINI